LESLEDARNHPRAAIFMTMECPAMSRLKSFGQRLSNVVQDGCPSQPQILRSDRHIVEHLQGVVKIVFVRLVVDVFHALEGNHLWKKFGQQSAVKQKLETV